MQSFRQAFLWHNYNTCLNICNCLVYLLRFNPKAMYLLTAAVKVRYAAKEQTRSMKASDLAFTSGNNSTEPMGCKDTCLGIRSPQRINKVCSVPTCLHNFEKAITCPITPSLLCNSSCEMPKQWQQQMQKTIQQIWFVVIIANCLSLKPGVAAGLVYDSNET